MKISVQGKLPRELKLTRQGVKAAAEFFAMRSAKRIGEVFRDVAVIVQDDAASDEAHRAIMGVEGATDVITQRYDAMPPEPEGVYGELYVNADQAIRFVAQMKRVRPGWDAGMEFLLYVAHGMDHLSGADDQTPEEYSRMRRRELRWLRDFASPEPRTPKNMI